MKEVSSYRLTMTKLKEWDPSSVIIEETLKRLNEEFPYDTLSVDKFLESEWVRFQMLLAYNFSKYFYGEGYVMRFIEFMDFRDMVENVLLNQRSEQSVYTRLINKLGISAELIPRKYVQDIYSSDEFLFGTKYIMDKITAMPEPGVSLDLYRKEIGELAQTITMDLAEKGYFGTYEKDYLVELMIAYRMGHTEVGNLYIASKIPKNTIKYEDLKQYVNRLWDKRNPI
jgi:hypothetical protein